MVSNMKDEQGKKVTKSPGEGTDNIERLPLAASAESGPADTAPVSETGETDPVAEKALRRYVREEELRPYQAELIRMQQYLEDSRTRMLILFEGRDAAGKGGTIRRVTRYMNEKHYRVVALGKPTEYEILRAAGRASPVAVLGQWENVANDDQKGHPYLD